MELSRVDSSFRPQSKLVEVEVDVDVDVDVARLCKRSGDAFSLDLCGPAFSSRLAKTVTRCG